MIFIVIPFLVVLFVPPATGRRGYEPSLRLLVYRTRCSIARAVFKKCKLF